MIAANQLPEERSVYEPPMVLPGEEMTPEQEEQALTAQVAGIVMGVATTKKALQDAVTNQIVALLHTADLTTTAGIKAFAKAAATIVRLATRQAQELTWTGVKMRTEAVGIKFDAQLPEMDDLPADLRQGRTSDLEDAYARLAEEYQTNLKRTKDDPVIKELVSQFEDEQITPLPRPDNISSDAVERIADGKADWAEAFAKESEAEGTLNPEGPSDEEIARDSLAARRREAEAEREAQLQKFAAAAESARAERKSKSDNARVAYDKAVAEREAAMAEEAAKLKLSDAEIESVIRRYAEQKAGERAERMVSQDVAGASRNVYRLALDNVEDGEVLGYRRVVHPELAKSGQSCGLCIVASTMEYHKADLLPIHSGCNCEVCEIYSKDGKVYDPGHIINMEDLEVFYREAKGSTHGWDLKKSRYKVVNHPEYGPTLINAHPNKTGKIQKEYVKANV